MKILAPVSSLSEALPLIESGARELYCGLSPAAWGKEHGENIWLNRRGPGKANLADSEELEKIVALAHRKETKVFLTMNQPGYVKALYPDLISFVRDTLSIGVDALIMADPGLIRRVKEKEPAAVIHVSSLASVLNSSSIGFFRSLGAQRIIFPRYLDLQVLHKMIEASERDLEFEVFILNDGCVFEEGFCHVSHAFGGAFCHNPAWSYKLREISAGGNKVSRLPAGGETFQQNVDEYKRWLWLGIKNFGGFPGPGGYPLGMCGLCALPALQALGIASLKIVGREASLRKKAAGVKLVRKTLDLLEAGCSESELRERAKELKGVPGLCRSGYMCYYR
ncbi:Peptidase U32 [Acididesulfobacillus acetoxydans]|uniref:Collagenase-like protease n=1 Tax=Acididesulfobacillus acetoxydans TaxID=1561005 RepID=A0A8S0W234_9FIRM|nr:U32 family peptidase [Acididesulfobacillus acetoxydans]CAA7600318.1 Peptidase U32 [Acididesulfobacillus acetoxydans]CEJ06094.1 Collagenase-like protease [Acididesulfobacillus acetoxydans]